MTKKTFLPGASCMMRHKKMKCLFFSLQDYFYLSTGIYTLSSVSNHLLHQHLCGFFLIKDTLNEQYENIASRFNFSWNLVCKTFPFLKHENAISFLLCFHLKFHHFVSRILIPNQFSLLCVNFLNFSLEI